MKLNFLLLRYCWKMFYTHLFFFFFIAAHCFKMYRTNFPPRAMLVSLGRYRLENWNETGSLRREIASYTLHPDYNHQSANGDSDLAILTLRIPVEFSPSIKPICMWYGSIDLQSVVNKIGYVVGWGRHDEYGNTYVDGPRMSKMQIVSQVKLSPFRWISSFSCHILTIWFLLNKKRNIFKMTHYQDLM